MDKCGFGGVTECAKRDTIESDPVCSSPKKNCARHVDVQHVLIGGTGAVVKLEENLVVIMLSIFEYKVLGNTDSVSAPLDADVASGDKSDSMSG